MVRISYVRFCTPAFDAYEGVTHSLCSLEFENHRPLYNWFVDELIDGEKPRQIEFARMNLNYTLTSKRKCLKLVQDNIVSGWDDPRMATISGMRRRGYPAEAIRDFCERIGVSKAYSVIDFALLEACVRDNLGANSARAMAVIDPVKLVIDNYPEEKLKKLNVNTTLTILNTVQEQFLSVRNFGLKETTLWLNRLKIQASLCWQRSKTL